MIKALTLVLAAATNAPAPSGSTVTPFRTDIPPRVDPVFGDISTLRKAVDEFLSLEAEMQKIREEFSTAVHATLAQLAPPGAPAPKSCPAPVAAHYRRALEAGGRFLELGRRLEGRFREIRRSDTLGDAVGLTPDYRWRVKKATELYMQLLRDYREMRVAFYDQLEIELRHAGCKLPTGAPAVAQVDPERDEAAPVDPSNPAAWELEGVDATTPAGPATGRAPRAKGAEAPPASVSPAVWIEIDNSQCGQPSRLYIDGAAHGAIAAKRRVSVRTRSGPHELCVLPETDKRACGDQGTVRRAYLYEGWTLSVRCGAK